MFSIIISEKGGAERRESFDKNEVNVGRVQGNDLTLPKGNVSKHHARLMFRDGRFIVSDLKSTNGTYVNGRKIAQPTIVREGDKIYIGDFVLRIEAAAVHLPETASVDVSPAPPVFAGAMETGSLGGAPVQPRPIPNATLKAPTHPPGAPLPKSQPSNVTNAPPIPIAAPEEPIRPRAPSMAPPPLPPAAHGVGGIRPTTLPLNQQMIAPPRPMPPAQPVAPAPAAPAPVVVAPRAVEPAPVVVAPRAVEPAAMSSVPSFPTGNVAATSPAAVVNQVATSPAAVVNQVATAPAAVAPIAAATGAPTAVPTPGPAPVVARPAAVVPPPAKSAPSSRGPVSAPVVAPPVSARVPTKEAPHQAARRLAMTMLMGRISDAVDLTLLRANPIVEGAFSVELERVAKAQAKAMRDEGEAPNDVDVEAVARDAHRELTGLGAFAPLLEDDDVLEIHCVRFDQVLTVRVSGSEHLGVEPFAFTSDQALRRVVARMAHMSGHGWGEGEMVVERRLPRASFVAVSSPSLAITVRKRRRVESSFDELTRAGTISRAMAQFLESCVSARANVLVAGDGAISIVAALASSGPTAERIAIVQDVEDIVVPGAHVASIVAAADQSPGDAVAAAAKLRPQRLVVSNLNGAAAAATLDAVTSGTSGVLAAAHAPTLRHALSRIVSQLIVSRSGLDLDTTREILADTFDVVVEVTASAAGPRVTRISELVSEGGKGFVLRDLFLWSPELSGDGAFAATGTVPRIAADLAAKGAKLDPTIFKRAAR